MKNFLQMIMFVLLLVSNERMSAQDYSVILGDNQAKRSEAFFPELEDCRAIRDILLHDLVASPLELDAWPYLLSQGEVFDDRVLFVSFYEEIKSEQKRKALENWVFGARLDSETQILFAYQIGEEKNLFVELVPHEKTKPSVALRIACLEGQGVCDIAWGDECVFETGGMLQKNTRVNVSTCKFCGENNFELMLQKKIAELQVEGPEKPAKDVCVDGQKKEQYTTSSFLGTNFTYQAKRISPKENKGKLLQHGDSIKKGPWVTLTKIGGVDVSGQEPSAVSIGSE